jgi:transposase-like protein
MTRDYTPEVKAAVMASLLAGQSVSSLAKEYNLPKGTVSGWRRQAETIAANGVATVATQKKQDQINDLILDVIVAQLKSQVAMAEHAGDKRWLTLQDASAVAMLMGVENDKVFRLLQALNNERPDPEPTQT